MNNRVIVCPLNWCIQGVHKMSLQIKKIHLICKWGVKLLQFVLLHVVSIKVSTNSELVSIHELVKKERTHLWRSSMCGVVYGSKLLDTQSQRNFKSKYAKESPSRPSILGTINSWRPAKVLDKSRSGRNGYSEESIEQARKKPLSNLLSNWIAVLPDSYTYHNHQCTITCL